MRRRISVAVGLLLVLGLSGCPTTFSGNAHVANGRSGCEQKCKRSKMRLSAMVFLGEYSSACVCELPPKPEAAEKTEPSAGASHPRAAAGAVGAAVGLMSQTAQADDASPAPVYRNY